MYFWPVAAMFSILASAAYSSDEKPQVKLRSDRNFGERFMNINFWVLEDNNRWARKLPYEPGAHYYDAKRDKMRKIAFKGLDGAQAYLKIKVGDGLKEAILYSPKGEFYINMPPKSDVNGDENNEIPEGKTSAYAFPPSYEELNTYRNLALNPYDFQSEVAPRDLHFPHVTASSECRNELIFMARNAIDGNSKNNGGHSSWKFRAWGPEKAGESWIKVDFGREVEIDKILLTLRADFPHDGVWQNVCLEFSDGKRQAKAFALKKSADIQEIKFPKTTTSYVKLYFTQDAKKPMWCALSEIEVYGRDKLPFSAFDKKGKKRTFAEALADLNLENLTPVKNRFVWRMLDEVYPAQSDAFLRDFGFDLAKFPKDDAGKIAALKGAAKSIFEKLNRSDLSSKAGSANTLKDAAKIYEQAINLRRSEFLKQLDGFPKKYVYVERYPIAPSFYGYTEGLSDARAESRFTPDSKLCMLEFLPSGEIKRTVLLEDKTGCIRDPDVSYDAKRVIFSWKKSHTEDDFHIYEMDLQSRKIKQLTFGKFADIEAKYLPTGEIVFNSSRCEQATDCWLTEVSNLYFMRGDGTFMRRVGFDQVCTTYPIVTEQGDIIYTRWDYNDRGQTFPQALFSMKYDGTFQSEVYGNKSWFPTVIGHARQIPNTKKYIAVLHGHHTAQRGKLAEIDPSKGRQEAAGVEYLAPRKKAEPVRIDAFGQDGPQFQYPYPLSEDLFFVTFEPNHAGNRSYPSSYGIYLMNSDGDRELVASHPYLDSNQIVAVAPRKIPKLEKSRVDFSKDKGYLFIRNIYYGDGVKGVKKGSIKKVRVVKIDYRRAPVGALDGKNDEGGVRVKNLVCTPVALGQGTWDTKEILGEVDVAEDGSVYFEIPARTPVYFQPIDENGAAVTTMRSWTAMQPNEFYSCLGCHGDRDTPNPLKLNIAKGRKPEKLKPFYDIKGGFSFRKHIQPILDKNCISCHNDRSVPRLRRGDDKISVASIVPTKGKKWLKLEEENSKKAVRAFSLLDYPMPNERAKREFNDAYYNLLQPEMGGHMGAYPIFADFKNPLINWLGMQSVPTLQPPYVRGAAKSEIMDMLRRGHGDVKLSREELDKIAAWIDLFVPYCGDYYEANLWSDDDKAYYKYYEDKGKAQEQREREEIQEYLRSLGKL